MDFDKQLKDIFYNPQTGFQGVKNLYLKAKDYGLKVTQKQVEDWLNEQKPHQLHKKQPPLRAYFPIKSGYQDHIWQIDLMYAPDPASNSNTNYLLCCLDIFTRFAWVKPLKEKKDDAVLKAMTDIFKESGRQPKIIESDNGSEFISNIWTNEMTERGIEMSYAEVGNHNRQGIVERFNQTMRALIEKFRNSFKPKRKKYIDVLQELVYNYNHTVHSSTDSKPAEPHTDSILNNLAKREEKAQNQLKAFQLGDRVRYLVNRSLFQKGAVAKWSDETYLIKKIGDKRYKLSNDQFYRYYEILKVPDKVGERDDHVLPKEVVEQEEKETKEYDLNRKIKKEKLNIYDPSRSGPAEQIFNAPVQGRLRQRKVEGL
jgi:hypothetical protein